MSDAAEGSAARWNERIARARLLAATYPAATEVLAFYAALAEYQKELLGREHTGALDCGHQASASPFLESLDLEPLLAAIPDFLSWLQRNAPQRLAEAAAEMGRLDRKQWRRHLHSYFGRDGRDSQDADQTLVFVLETLLQPFAERLAVRSLESGVRRLEPEARTLTTCPLCASRPVVGVLREEGHGAKRTLLCGLCLTERDYRRVICPACGEQQFDVLPVYTADQFAYVRIEACEKCRSYLKTIDLTKDGLAVPLVDDIASVSLDLWAREQGYIRLRSNLLGL